MKTFFKWTAIVAGAAVGGTLVVKAVQRGRARMKDALGRAEAVADHTRAALEETQAALQQTREAI
jgi:hypothetical protein